MDRTAKLRQLAAVLLMAANHARQIATGANGASRENALATQIEGIALEFEHLIEMESSSPPSILDR